MGDMADMMWLAPWDAIDAATSWTLDRQLMQEVTEGHPLFGVAAHALARNASNDDVLFCVDDHPQAFAVVHLVWQGPQHTPWPATTFYDSREDWIESCMKPDHVGR